MIYTIVMAPPRDKFGIDLIKESINKLESPRLSIAIWPGTKNPNADVIRIQIRGLANETYENAAEITIYRDEQGYRVLPPLQQQVEQKQETIDDLSKKVQEHFDIFEEESKDTSLEEDS